MFSGWCQNEYGSVEHLMRYGRNLIDGVSGEAFNPRHAIVVSYRRRLPRAVGITAA